MNTKIMKIETVAPDLKCIPSRLRALNPTKVDELAESMTMLGLLHPITVVEHGEGDYQVVAGAHRLAAAVKLGWHFIDAVSVDHLSDAERQIVEIDENLMRAELSPTERAEHLAKRAEVWAAREIQVAQLAPPEKSGGYKSPPQQTRGFAADTAEKTGVSKAAINRAISRAESIPADVRDQIKGTALDKGNYLDSIKEMEPEKQREQVNTDLTAPPRPRIRADQFALLMRDWNKANDDERQRFIEWVTASDKPGDRPIAEIVERLRSGLRQGRIEDRDRGFVAGALKQAKSGRWWPTPKQESLMRRILDEMMAPEVIDHGDADHG
jgi:hypothetical protein